MADDAWTAPEVERAPAKRPNVVDLATRAVSTIGKDPGGYLLAGLPPALVGLVFGVGGVLLAYAAFFAGMVPGVLSDDPGEAAVMGMGLGLGLLFPAILAATVLVAPMIASLHRAVWRSLLHGEKLTIGSALSTFGQDLGKVLAFNVLSGVAIFAGVLLCYVPGLIAMALLVFAGPAIYVHRLGVGEAIGLSIRSAQDEPGWHLGFFALSFVIVLVLQYVPIVGMMLYYTAHTLFVLLAYRELYGDGDLPRGYGA